MSVESGGHPETVDSSRDSSLDKKIDETEEKDSFYASMLIGTMLGIPMLIIIIIAVIIRLKKRGEYYICSLEVFTFYVVSTPMLNFPSFYFLWIESLFNIEMYLLPFLFVSIACIDYC